MKAGKIQDRQAKFTVGKLTELHIVRTNQCLLNQYTITLWVHLLDIYLMLYFINLFCNSFGYTEYVHINNFDPAAYGPHSTVTFAMLY